MMYNYQDILQQINNNTLATLDVQTVQTLDAREERTLSGHSGTVHALAPLSEGRLASGSADNTIKVWDVQTSACLQTFKGHSDTVWALAPLSEGRLASGSWDCTIKVWDVQAGACLQTLSGHSNAVVALAPLSEGRLASGSADNTIKVWDVQMSACLQTLSGHSSYVYALAPLSEGRLASGSDDRTIKVWDIQTSTCLQTLSGHSDSVYALAPLSEGRLASGSCDGTIKVWDVQTSECLQTLSGHSSWVCALAPLSEGRLASGSWDCTIKVWDVQTSECLQTLSGHSHTVWALAPLSEGRLASGSMDKTIKVWEMQMSLRPLNQDEIIRLLETLTHNNSLTTLSLDDVSLKEASQKAVLALLSVHPKITHIELINTQIKDTFVEALIGIAKESNLLTTVILDKNPISQALLRKLQTTLRINAARKGQHADIKQPMLIQPAHPAIKIPPDYLCPLNHTIMSDPVAASDGNTYEREAIEKWLETHDTSPLEGTQMPHKHVIPNKTLKRIIGGFLDEHPQLRLGDEFHQSKALRQQLLDAIQGSQYETIQACVKKDPRFLTQPLVEQKHLLQFACECKDHKVLETILALLGETCSNPFVESLNESQQHTTAIKTPFATPTNDSRQNITATTNPFTPSAHDSQQSITRSTNPFRGIINENHQRTTTTVTNPFVAIQHESTQDTTFTQAPTQNGNSLPTTVGNQCTNAPATQSSIEAQITSSISMLNLAAPPPAVQMGNYLNTQGYTLSNLNIAISHQDITYGEQIGRGGFGIVYKGSYQNNDVALKTLLHQQVHPGMLNEFKRETLIMANLQSLYLVGLIGVCLEPGNRALVMEYMAGGTLWDLLRDAQIPMPWGKKLGYGSDIAKGMTYLHDGCNVVHCDLKSLNILLDAQHLTAKITDFGLSKMKHRANTIGNSHYSTAHGGTPCWTAPELFAPNTRYTPAADVYSFAIVLWELASRQVPYENKNLYGFVQLITFIADGGREDIPQNTPPSIAQLIGRCWDGRSEVRPTMHECVNVVEEELNQLRLNAF